MKSRNIDMQAIFSELSEKNKDMVILIAKSVKFVQETNEQSSKSKENANQVNKHSL